MKQKQKRFGSALLAGILASALALTGCGGIQQNGGGDSGGTPAGATGSGSSAISRKVVIGTMATEDILPMWVAEAEGIFAEQGLDATVMTFQSGQELSTAVASGSVDLAMTDIMVSARLTDSGTPVVMEWVTLGATSEQGRFGIMTNPESGIKSLKDLAGVPIGVASCTVPEYVMDKLLQRAGVPTSQIISMSLPKMPVRYEMMTTNQVAAAALPGSLLALGEATGMITLGDDSTGENLSVSVMIARKDLAESNQGVAIIERCGAAWNEAVARINAKPESYRALLVEKAQLPQPVQASYPICTYAPTERPTSAMVEPVLSWMLTKGYLDTALSYDLKTGTFTR